MKKIILSLIVSLFDIFIIVSAQTIELIPNLNDNDNVYWGTKNVLNNNNPYMRIEYKGNLFINYSVPLRNLMQIAKFDGVKFSFVTNPSRNDCFSGIQFVYKDNLYLGICNNQSNTQLAKFDGNKSIITIPNPKLGLSNDFISIIASFNNKEYLEYSYYPDSNDPDHDPNLRNIIAEFDGENITIIPNSTFEGDSIIMFNNKLFFEYRKSGKRHLGVYDGSKILSIPNTSNLKDIWEVTPLKVFNNTLYIDYKYNCMKNGSAGHGGISVVGNHQLFLFNGDSLVKIQYPINLENNYGSNYGITRNLIVYKDKLHSFFINPKGRSQLIVINGNKSTLIQNPNDGNCDITDGLIIYKDYIFFKYETNPISHLKSLARFDGEKITLIPNLNLNDNVFGDFIIFNGYLYFGYENSLHKRQLAKYDGAKITLYLNPDDGEGFSGKSCIFKNCLYFDYENAKGNIQLAKFYQ